MTPDSPVRAAGCVVWRPRNGSPELLLVHRPRYSDWSFPKGKLDRGESDWAAALREVAEETGLRVRIGSRLPDQLYTVSGDPKVVAYWTARPVEGAPDTFKPNDEVDRLRWVPLAEARATLTYPRDRELLDEFADSDYDGEPLLVVRHAEACKRSKWRGDDAKRPLKPAGEVQAAQLVPLLTAYGVSVVASSDATRCTQTVAPYVEASGANFSKEALLSEQGYDEPRFASRVRQLLRSGAPTAICIHRPQLRPMFEAVGVEPIGLMPAEVVVLHRCGERVVDLEQHSA